MVNVLKSQTLFIISLILLITLTVTVTTMPSYQTLDNKGVSFSPDPDVSEQQKSEGSEYYQKSLAAINFGVVFFIIGILALIALAVILFKSVTGNNKKFI